MMGHVNLSPNFLLDLEVQVIKVDMIREEKYMKKAISYLFTIVLIVATSRIILSNINPAEISYLLYRTNRYLLLTAVLCMVLYWIIDALIIQAVSSKVGVKFSLRRSLKITLIGQYYSEITPYAVGCQPAQIYTMMGYSVPAGKGTLIVINKFVIYRIAFTVYMAMVFFLRHDFIYDVVRGSFSVIIIGLVLHMMSTSLFVALFLNPKIVEKAVFYVLSFLHRIKIIKDMDTAKDKIMAYIGEYSDSMDKIKGSHRLIFIVFILSALQLSCYFAIGYFIFRGLSVNTISFTDVMTLQSMIYLIITVIPTPGTIGTSEAGFYLLFKRFVSPGIMPYATLLWSLINYYLNLICGGIVTLVNHFMPPEKA